MARLIPQKQIEEVNIFKDSISVGNSVFISGSLLVSQSVDIGNDLTTAQRITGSVQITGSVNIDGDLTFARAESRLDATASFSDVSVDTQKFGGIPVAEFGGSDSTIYVSATRGDDSNDGRSPQFPVRTIKRAAQIVTPGDDGRYGLPTGSNFTGFRIDVQAGTYLEDNPIELPRNTTVWGAGLRVSKVVAKNENEDLFWVNSGNYLAEMTFAGLRVFPSVDDSQKGFAISFAPNAFITTSPYIQNCSMISNQENSFLEAYEEIPPGGGGLNVDGNRIHPDSPLASMVLDAYTQVAPNGVGCQVVGRGFIQLVSFFTNFSAYSVKVIDGGQAVLLNSNTSFGDFGMYASGSRFITGSGGNTEAFLNVQDNYSIIVDTIERGLDEIPDLVPNTKDGIKVTNELQIFNTGEQATNDDAKTVVSDYRLISNLIERGVEDKLPILALSSDRGYNSGSVWNVSGDTQITSSITASVDVLNTIDSNYNIVLDIIERGNTATSSYDYVDNVSSSIFVTDVEQYKTTPVTDSTKNTIGDRFDTVISIIRNGVDVIPEIKTNTSQSFKVNDTSQYITDISSSLVVRELVSASFSTLYNILDNGTGSAPNIIESSSIENPIIDYQNAYTLLRENIPFVQSETVSYISSSWSTQVYNEDEYKDDISTIVSGAAHDLLFGGNEEIVRIGINQFNEYEDSVYTEKNRILTGIKYIAGVYDNILSDVSFIETTAELDNAYDLIFNNKSFIQSESIAYLSSSWSTFDYNEAKCARDIGFILDAVATDIKYGGNERSVIAGNFYYKYPSNATVNYQTNIDGQLNQTIDGINYAKRLAEKLVKNETFVTQSSSTLSVIDTIFENRSLIQNETITYINTTYPNFSYNETKCKRDTGYIIDAVLTDLKYGGVERTQNAGLYYFSYPSIANTTQLEETLEGIRYSNGFVSEVAQSNLIENPSQQLNINKKIKTGDVDYITSSFSGSDLESTHISGSFGIVEDIIRFGNDSILAAIAENTGSFDWTVTSPLNVSEILQITASVSTSISSSIFDDISGSFDTVVKIIESGSSIVTEETIGTGSAPVPEAQIGDPISTIGIPKDSYGDGLLTTVVTTSIPTFELVENTEAGIKFGNDTQITGSITSSVSESLKVSSSFSDIIDIIRYGTSGSLTLSGSFDTSTYYEVITPETGDYYIINRAQLDEFDGVRAGGYFNTEENTGSFEDGIKDPTLTLKRGEMYTFSVNALKYDLNPFYIKTARKPDKEALYNEGVTNNGVNFGTLTFIVPLEAPDRLYYVNGNNVSASGILNIVDNLPISDTQRYLEVPSKGFVEITTNNVDNIKISDISQYSSSFSASVDESHEISSSFATTIEILKNGVDNLPTIVENTSGSIKVTNTSQITSSITPTEYELNSVSSSYAIVIDVLQNGTGSLPTEISNTSASIRVTDIPQYISSSVSGTLENVEFISSSVSIVYNIVQLGSSGSYTASLYDTGSGPQTDESTIAAYEIIRNNISFIQSESLAYLSSSWSTASYDEAKCGRDIGLIISGAAEDLIWNTTSASVVNGKFYLEYPSQAESSQLNQTLDGIEYASKLTQKLIQNIEFVTASNEASASHQLLLDNKLLIQNETIEYISSSWSDFVYSDVLCRRDIGHIVDAAATDILYGGNERSIQAASFYYSNPSAATGSQLNQTVDAINYARRISDKILQNEVLELPQLQTLGVAELISENRSLIQEETIQFLSSSWSTFEYNEAKCRRDTGYIIDAVVTDFVYGGNERAVNAGEFYYLYPSDATGSQLNQTVDGITYAQRLTNKLINNVTLVTSSLERRATKDLLIDNKALIQNEVIHFISSSWSTFEYIESKCKRDVGYIIDAIATDILYGGNERSVVAGEFYYRYPSEATTTQLDQTITGVKHAAGLSEKIITNELLENPNSNTLEAYNRIRNNRSMIQSETVEFIDSLYPFFTYNREKCKRDTGFIIDAVATDLLWGGNERSIIAGDYYYRYPSQATTFQLKETIEGIRYAETILNSVVLNEILERPKIIFNSENHIKVDGVPQYSGSMAISGSNLNEISSSFEIINNIISGGLVQLPTEIKSVNSLTKVTDTLQVTESYSGSQTQIGIISASIDMINDIIRLGSDDIPFTIAKYFQTSELDTPQNLTTGSISISSTEAEYNNARAVLDVLLNAGDYGVDLQPPSDYTYYDLIVAKRAVNPLIPQELEDRALDVLNAYNEWQSDINADVTTEKQIVSESFSLINDIIENTTSSIVDFVDNTYNKRKFTNTTQYSSSISASAIELTKIESGFEIVANIVENGLSQKPTIVKNNTDIDNLIKVTDTPQYISASAADKLQSKIVSSSISIVTDIIENGSGSAPDIIEYTTPSDSPKARLAYDLIINNLPFIVSESIAYISSSWSDFSYNEASCSRDVALIVSGAAEDLIWNSNSASVVNGKFYLEYPSAATGSQLQQTLDGINYASTLTQHIIRNRTFVTASSEVSSSYNLLVDNKAFIQNETIAYLSSSWSDFYYSESKCKRDIGYIVDAVATDLKYGGNERSVIAGDYYYRFPSAAIIGGVPSEAQQKDPTVTGINYAKSLALELVSGSEFVTASNEIEYTYDTIRNNRGFIQAETVAFVNAKYPNLEYNEASCSRDTGFIVDAVATDLRWGGNQRSYVAGQYYYKFPSKATTDQLGETTDAVIYASKLVNELIDKNTLPIPSASLNTDNGIKVTDLSPATFLPLSDPDAMVEEISASFAIVSDAILNGTGSTPTASPYGAPLVEDNVVRSHAMITASVPFIQAETIAYLSSSWSDFSYNEASCSRDVGLIVNGVAEDLLHGVVSASVVNAKFYYEYPSEATSSQAEQTVDGINYAYRLTSRIIRGLSFDYPSNEASSSWELIRSNKQFIKDETIAYISSSWSDFSYNEASCSRDVGHILNAVATDILYGGNERSIIAGNFYYKYPSSATTTQLNPTITGINYAGDIAENVIVNNVFENASAERIAGNESLLNNRTFIQSESLAYLTASWSTFEYDKDKCARDVGHIVDAVATDFLYGGNERSRTAGEFYYLYPSEATTTQANQTTDGVKYAGRIAEALVQNIQFVTASTEVSASFDLLRKNKPFIQEETIQYVSSSWSGVYYDEAKCRRDTGYIIDAAATDLLYGGNERSVIAGNYYFLYPSAATERGTPSVVSQLDPTTTGIKYASGVSQNVIQNVEWNEPSASVLIAADLLVNNKTFIQKETIAFLSSSWSEFPYNEVSCSRDLGYIIDAVRTDLVYGGNERSIQAATFYYYIPSVAITEQKPQTIDGIDFAKGIAEKVIKQDQLTFAGLNRRNGYADLRAAKKFLQSSAISYTEAAFPGFEYNEEKCYRDTGFILDAISTDLLYGGNERSIEAAKSYYNGVYGDASVVINEQKKETAETNRYLRTLFQKFARNAPLELFGSLIITTGHDFSYAGAGVTYKALPPNQGGNGVPDPDKEIIELGGGRVFFTAGNELGDFKIGTGLVINQATGTLQGRTFSRSLFSLVTPFSLALEG